MNAVAPGSVPTPGAVQLNDRAEYERRARTIPLRRLGREEDNAQAIAFLLSKEASFINGVTKFVVRPNVPPESWESALHYLADTLFGLQT